MKRHFWLVIAAIAVLGWRSMMAQSDPAKTVATFPGAALKWIHAAEPEFEKQKLNLDIYTVSVDEQGDSVIVSLASLDSVKGARGSTGSYPGFEVEIRKKDLKTIRSSFVH